MTFLLTLEETITILLPEHTWIRESVYELLKSRWSFVRSKYISEGNPIPLKNNKGALPFELACDSVTKWIPWALHNLLGEITQVCNTCGDYTPENIAFGAKASEEFVV